MKLNPKKLVEEVNFEFINKTSLLLELRIFFQVNLGETLKFQGYYKNFLVPLLEDLGIPMK